MLKKEVHSFRQIICYAFSAAGPVVTGRDTLVLYIHILMINTDIRHMAGTVHPFMLAVKHRSRLLIGNPSAFSLEARIFHSISLGIALLLLVYIPYNLVAGLFIAALSCGVFSSLFFFEYYRSRFLHKAYRSLLFGMAGLVLLSVNYFANSGIQGSTDLIWPVYLLFLLTICTRRNMVTWLVVYIAVFALVHLTEYHFPELVHYPFRAGQGQLTDRITAFPIPVISIAIIIGLFRRNYEKDRAIVAQRDMEKSRLLSILSHDLRTPFIQVQQYVELLNNHSLSQTERVYLGQALKQTNDQTLHLVTNLLYWSRSQLEGFSMRLTPLLLSDTLKNTVEIANGLSNGKGIQLTADIHPEIRVMADADMLQLVVRNLLQNAIKFTAPGGSINVLTESADDSCRISVHDTGRGIGSEQLSTLFSGAASTTGTANEKGVGLGLQLCKEFMERQGGGIFVESTPGKGARFTIHIPMI